MGSFLYKVCVFGLPLLILMVIVFMLEGGYSDPFYLRFTTPKQSSMIIGTSKAAQGLLPSILESELHSQFKMPIYNYAFTLAHSPYGQAYFNSIKNKLDQTGNNGVFILTVDPWSISQKALRNDDESSLDENGRFIAEIDYVSMSPNFEYLLKFYPDPYYHILWRRFKPTHQRLHDDGWLEVTVKMDSSSIKRRKENKLKSEMYSNPGEYRFSEIRYSYLKQTIEFLQRHGTVYLVRLPVDSEMLENERIVMADFEDRMRDLQEQYGIRYFDMTVNVDRYTFVDGNHLYKESSKKASFELAHWITETIAERKSMGHKAE
jgi:hypothetical protein